MATKLSPFPTNIPPGSSYFNEIYERTRFLVNQLLASISWATITGKPTTIAGYGITDAATLTGAETLTNKTLTAPNIGAATGTSLALSGNITTGTGTLHKTSVALTNGAAAAAGTLLNAPSAGNPTKWIPIDDNGTTRYIPSW